MQKTKLFSYMTIWICFYGSAIASEKIIQLTPEFTKAVAFSKVAQAIASKKLADEASTKLAAETVQTTTTTAGQALSKSLPTFYLAYQVGGLGLQAVRYAFPTEEKIAQDLCTTDQLQSVQMFEQFKTCLLTNPKHSSVLGELGIPTACEIAARQLAKKGAAQEVNQMIHFYTSPTITLILKKQ